MTAKTLTELTRELAKHIRGVERLPGDEDLYVRLLVRIRDLDARLTALEEIVGGLARS